MENTDKIMTIHDIAKDLGVSASTVSRAISGKGRIGDATRERILAYIEEKGFYPNASARSLAQAKTNNIAIILPEMKTLVDMPFFHTCMYGVEEMAHTHDYDIIVVTTSRKDVGHLERLIMNRKVDGMILTRTYKNDYFAQYLKEKGIPFVTIGRTTDEDIVQVDHDAERACRELTGVLFAQGLRRIAYLGGNGEQMVNGDRREGYKKACREAGQKDDEILYMDLMDRSAVRKAMSEALAGQADCLLCQDDYICDEVLMALEEEKINVPEQMKVASCHYSRLLERYPITITSLKFDAVNLGREACRLLMDQIGGEAVPGRTLLDYEIIMGESTDCY